MAEPAFWQDRPVLVTGATGFAGTWLTDRVHRLGASVVCLVRDQPAGTEFGRRGLDQRVTLVRGDLTDQGLMERVLGEYEVDTVLHLAAQTIVGVANDNPISTFDSNIRGTWALLEASRRTSSVRQIVVASSDKAYGETGARYDESTPLNAEHPYDASKACADILARTYARSYGLPVAITRCGNFFGGGDLNWNRLVPGTIRSVLRGRRPVIRSDGTSIRDYLYVEDAAAAYTALAEALASDRSLAGEAFNFSNEIQLTVSELVGELLQRLGSDLEPDIRADASNEISVQGLIAEKARARLGWHPQVPLSDALDRTVEWYRRYLAPAPEAARVE